MGRGKHDLFLQGFSLKWQEKVLPSASTFANVHQAQVAEEQAKRGGNSLSESATEAMKETAKTPGRAELRSPHNSKLKGRCLRCGSY